MRTVRFDTLREAVRVRYGLPDFTATGYPTLDEVNALINRSLQSYYAMLMEAFGDRYFAATSTEFTQAGVGVVSVPNDCAKLLSVHWVRGANDVQDVPYANRDDMYLAAFDAQNWDSYAPRYLLSGTDGIQLLPAPNAVYTLLFDYAALPADLEDNTDTFPAGPGWEKWVVADVCIEIATGDEADASQHEKDRDRAEAVIRLQKPRNESMGRQVVDRRGARAQSRTQRRVLPWWNP